MFWHSFHLISLKGYASGSGPAGTALTRQDLRLRSGEKEDEECWHIIWQPSPDSWGIEPEIMSLFMHLDTHRRCAGNWMMSQTWLDLGHQKCHWPSWCTVVYQSLLGAVLWRHLAIAPATVKSAPWGKEAPQISSWIKTNQSFQTNSSERMKQYGGDWQWSSKFLMLDLFLHICVMAPRPSRVGHLVISVKLAEPSTQASTKRRWH